MTPPHSRDDTVFNTATELHLRELASHVRALGVTSFKYFMNFKGEEGRYLGLQRIAQLLCHAAVAP